MIFMDNLIASFKRYLALAVLILILFLLIWLKFFIVPRVPQNNTTILPSLTPSIAIPQVLVSPIPFTESPSVANRKDIVFKYSGLPAPYPQTLPVYNATKQPVTDLYLAKSIVGKFGFSGEPVASEKNNQQANYYIWQQNDGKKTLSVGGNPPIVHYNNFSNLNNQPAEAIDKKFFVERSREELEKLPLSISQIDFSAVEFSYYKYAPSVDESEEGNLEATNDEKEASQIVISLAYKLGDYSSVANLETFSPIFLVFDPLGNLYKMTVVLFSSLPLKTSFQTIPFDEVVSSLQEKAIIVSVVSPNQQEMDLPVFNLSEVNLDKAQVVYNLSTNGNPDIKPYLWFSGSAKDKKTQEDVLMTVVSPINQ